MLPARFDQNVRELANQRRFRHIGNPYAFLDSIGFAAIREELYRGANLVDVAERINVSVSVLRKWLEENGHNGDVDAASPLSAEGYLAEGRRLLAEAQNDFELKKAKELINHARWLAERLNKPQYGKNDSQIGQQAAVQYNFFIGNTPEQTKTVKLIDADSAQDVLEQTDVPQFVMPRVHLLPEPEDIGPFVEPPLDPLATPPPAYLRDST